MAEATPVWVVGAGGLIGGHVRRLLLQDGREVLTTEVPWGDSEAAAVALERAATDYAAACGDKPWSAYWCAGAGVVATGEAELAAEAEVFGRWVRALALMRGPGTLVLCSSAGGVYAGSDRPPFTEESTPVPVVAYGRVRLAMETDAVAVLGDRDVAVVRARLANVYGPGQALSKPQGLVNQLCLTQLSGRPLPLRVSADTLRDYVYVEDAARVLLALGEVARARLGGPGQVVKNVCSGSAASIGQVVGTARQVLRRPPRISVTGGLAVGQVADLRVRSVVWTDLDRHLRTPLVAGLSATAADVLARGVMDRQDR